MGSICWFSWRAATSCALSTAPCAFTVIFSNRNIGTSFFPPLLGKRGWPLGQPLNLRLHGDARPELPAGGRRGHRRSPDVNLDLLWLGFFFLWNAERKHTILVIGLDCF